MAGTAGNLGDRNSIFGNVPVVLDQFIPDNSYPTGGYAVTGQLWGLAASGNVAGLYNNGIRGIIPVGANTAALGYQLYYNSQTGKVQVLVASGSFTPVGTVSAPTITTASGNPATAPIGVITGALAQTAGASGITGIQAPTFTGTPGAAAPFQEVASATDLSALIFDVLVLAAGE